MIQINAEIDSKTQEFLQVKSETGLGTQMVRRDQKKKRQTTFTFFFFLQH